MSWGTAVIFITVSTNYYSLCVDFFVSCVHWTAALNIIILFHRQMALRSKMFCFTLSHEIETQLHYYKSRTVRAGHRKFTLNSAKQQEVFRKFAVTFRTSATANAHCTSANLDRNIYCYFVLVMTCQILPWPRH